MAEKRSKKHDTRTADTPVAPVKRKRGGQPGVSGNPNGRPLKGQSFAEILRKHLFKHKKFRRADGSLMETSEIELIAIKVIRELRTAPEVNHRLLNAVLDRIDGKPKESVEIDATIQNASDLDARDVLLQRLAQYLDIGEEEDEDTDEDQED